MDFVVYRRDPREFSCSTEDTVRRWTSYEHISDIESVSS